MFPPPRNEAGWSAIRMHDQDRDRFAEEDENIHAKRYRFG